jgi:hypothetical protein
MLRARREEIKAQSRMFPGELEAGAWIDMVCGYLEKEKPDRNEPAAVS